MDYSLKDLENHVGKVFSGLSTPVTKEPLGDREQLCEKHGTFKSSGARLFGKREIWTQCPDCEEERIAKARREEAERRAAAARAQLELLVGQTAIPARFIGRTFENFNAENSDQQKALEVARAYAENFEVHFRRGDGLIFAGLPGTGKSHLAGAILQALLPAHCGLYVTCMGVIRAVRGTWRKDSERSETEVLSEFGGVPLLVLDEIGVQYGTDGEQTILFDVLDRRYREMKPTILLTNQDKKGFREFIGDRSFDRLIETSRWVNFDWSSYRAQARREAA